MEESANGEPYLPSWEGMTVARVVQTYTLCWEQNNPMIYELIVYYEGDSSEWEGTERLCVSFYTTYN